MNITYNTVVLLVLILGLVKYKIKDLFVIALVSLYGLSVVISIFFKDASNVVCYILGAVFVMCIILNKFCENKKIKMKD